MNIVSANVSTNSDDEKVIYKMDCYMFAHSFISNHITIQNRYYLLPLRKT